MIKRSMLKIFKLNKKKKRLILFAAILLMAGLVAGAIFLPYLIPVIISPESLISNTTKAMEEFTGADIRIGSAELSVIDGVIFQDVRVLVPMQKRKLHPEFSFDDASVLKAKSCSIKLERKGFLGLQFRLKEIHIDSPTLQLTRLKSTNRWNWQLFLGDSAPATTTKSALNIGPPIYLSNGRVVLTELGDEGVRNDSEIYFDANAVAMDHKAFYRVAIQTKGELAGSQVSLDFDHHTGSVLSGRISPTKVEDLMRELPAYYAKYCEQLGLSGQLAISEFCYAPPLPMRAVIVLDDFASRVPVSKDEFWLADKSSAFNIDYLNGEVVLDDNAIRLSGLKGKLNDADCVIDGVIPIYEFHSDSNLSARLVCEEILFPNYNEPEMRDYADRFFPWQLCHFLDRFKPIGRVSLDLRFELTSDEEIGYLLNGYLKPIGCSAAYVKFPYRVENIRGSVDIVDNRFYLNNITGETGEGSLVVNGEVSNPTKTAEVSLEINSTATPIDEKLFRALRPRDKKIFKQFNAVGFANTMIKLYTPFGANTAWTTSIRADLFDTSILYEKFPYPLDDLKGQLLMTNNKIEMKNISASHGSAKINLSGSVENPKSSRPNVKIDLTAENINIDDSLVDALPEHTRQIVKNSKMSGVTDIHGLLMQEENEPFSYIFDCDLKKIDLRPSEFPYPFKNVFGQITLTPETLSVKEVYFRNGEESIRARGLIDFTPGGKDTKLSLEGSNVQLSSQLRDALPPAATDIWGQISPSGKVNITADLDFKMGLPWAGLINFDLVDVTARYKKMDPVSKLSGHVLVTPTKSVLTDIRGQFNEKAPIRFDGVVEYDSKSKRMIFSKLEVKNAPVTKGFIETFSSPSLTQRFQWNEGGSVSCLIDDFRVDIFENNTKKVNLVGELNFENIMMASLDSKATSLNYKGKIISQTSDDKFGLDGELKLSNLNWSDRKIENVSAKVDKPLADAMLNIDNMRAEYAGGQISGMAKLNFSADEILYGLQLTLDSLDAADALGGQETINSINGTIKGEIYLRGKVGDKYSQLGGGVIQITGSEVFKIPLMAKIYRILKSKPPNLATFHNITARFASEKYKVRFDSVELVGPLISFIGSGDLNLSNKRVNLKLIAATPKSLDNIPLLPEIMRGASGEISEIKIQGSMEHPNIRVRPLQNLSKTLKDFFDGKKVH